MIRSILVALAAASLSSAHFTLNWPTSAGFDEDIEATGPCGGFTPEVNETSTEVSVDRFAISVYSSHPAGSWSISATNSTEAPYNFTQVAAVDTSGLGKFCLTYFSVPSEWAGTSGVLQVVDASADGTLYQCAPVRFVSGANSTTGSDCTNQTGFSATWTSSQSTTNTSGASPSAATTGTSSSTAGAALATGMGSVLGLGLIAAGLAL